jgi:hypothetical protein
MPYIKIEDRDRLMQPGEGPKTAGELNFIISLLVDQYWHQNGENYQAFNDIFGVLSGVSHEYYRRKCAYYEDVKMMENGDVFRRIPVPTLNLGEGQAPPAPQEPLRPRFAGSKVAAARRAKEEATKAQP